MAVLLHVQLLEAGFAMHAWMRGTFGTVGLVLVGLLLALFAVAPTARADVYDPADWAPSVWSDKADYAPGELVTLSGAHWEPGETVNVVVNDDAGQTWRRDVDVTADDAGGITDSFNLPEHFVAVYSVRATGASSGAVASTSFTDGNVKVKTNANGFTFRLDWTRHNGTNTAPQKTCTAVAAAQTNGFDATVGFSGGNQFSEGVPADSSIVLDAADTASNGHVFEGWTGETAGDTFLTRTDPHEICVRGDFTGSRTYVANYAVNSVPAVTRDTASRTVDEGQTATNTGTWSDANALDTVTLSASVGTVTKNSDGTWSWSYATTDGPGQSQTVTITATDSHGGRSTTSFALTVDNVAPTVTLAGPAQVDESTTDARLYSFSVSDPGQDGFTVASGFPSCGTDGSLVDGSLSTTASGGSFECRFPDGPANPTVSMRVRDADEPAGSMTADSNVATRAVSVANVAPMVSLSGANDLEVGESTSAGREFSFAVSDPGADTPVVTADCGEAGELVEGSVGADSFKCVFADGDAETDVSVSVDDGDGGSDSDGQMVTVSNVAPAIALSADNDLEVDEARAAARVFRFTASDPGADELAIDAGCGDHGDLVAGAVDDSFECKFPNGDATTDVTVSADDGDGGTDSDSHTVTVANVAPSVSVSGVTTVDEGDVETYTYSVSDPGTDAVSAVETKCGDHGVKVPDSDSEVGTTGTFECRFPDGPDDTTVSAKAADSDGDTGEPGALGVHVSNVAPLVTLTGAGEVDEGGTETYSYSVEDPGQDSFTVDEHFPDCDFGATDNGVLVGDPVKDASGGSFQCRFPDGTRTATVKIKATDSDGASTTDSEDVVVVEVANAAPEVTAAADQSSREGESKEFDLGSFTDPGDDADWTIDVTWGDGGTQSFTTSTTGGLGSLSHTFADGPASYLVIVTVTDKDGASDSATLVVDVANVAPVVTLSGADLAAEGDTKLYEYTVTDGGADPDPEITESCGDNGVPVDTPEPHGFGCTFPDGPAGSTVSVTADDGDTSNNVGSDEIDVEVENVAPLVALSGAGEVDEGGTETYSYSVEDPGQDSFTVDEHFPDCDFGATDNGVLVGDPVTDASGGSFQCRFPDGTRTATVKIKVTDSDGASTTDSEDVVVVEVANVAPALSGQANQTANEGTAKSFDLGSFTDQGDDADWTVHVEWGDESSDLDILSKDAAGSLGSLEHTFADGPRTYTVTVTVSDKDGAEDSATFDVEVANVAPTLELTGPTVVREGETRTYGYAIAEPGDDAVQSVETGCGDAGELVDGSHQRDGANGSFDCFFPDGTAQTTVSARATDDDGDTGPADEVTVDVANMAPVVHLDGDTTASEGTTHTYTFTVADPGDDTWHAADQTPDCDADGSTGILLVGSYTTDDEGGSFRCSFPDGPANPRVRMKVADEDGASDGDSESVRVVAVSNVVPQITPPADQPANEGASTSFELGSIADPGPDAPWAVDIGWGDGSPHTTFTVDELGSLGSRSHTYPNGPASKTVTITVTDDNGDTGTSTFEVDVANVAPTASNPKLELDAVLGTAKASFNYADAGWLDEHDASFFTWNVGSPLTTVTPLTASFPAATGTASSSQRLSAGCYSLTVAGTAKDNDGGESAPLAIATNQQFSVHASGFRPPIMDNERNIAKYGNVVPVKVVLTDRCTNASVTSAQLFITLAKGTGNEFIEDSNLIAESVSSADTGSQMRVVDGMYMFNLSTKGLQANADYAVRVRLGSTSGPVLLQAVLQPKK